MKIFFSQFNLIFLNFLNQLWKKHFFKKMKINSSFIKFCKNVNLLLKALYLNAKKFLMLLALGTYRNASKVTSENHNN